MPPSPAFQALHGLTVLERGWLSSNNVLIPDATGATLVDSGHCVHAPQTVALVRQALQGAPLARVLNTHLHSDHCGGNAALQRAFGAAVGIPPGQAAAVAAWDEDRLSYRPTGQRCERFQARDILQPGALLRLGGRAWQVLAAPGHDPDAVMLFDTTGGVLLSADALWEHGLGVVLPEIEGIEAFDVAEATLDLIATLPVSVVVPGHGPAFTGVAEALARARSRLAGFRAEPARHAHYAAKALLKYHVMEEQLWAGPPQAPLLPSRGAGAVCGDRGPTYKGDTSLEALHRWAEATPMMRRLWQGPVGHPRTAGDSLREWTDALVAELRGRGALACSEGRVQDR
jgi:glyoxylase-like metal-dependent hydrolase (beta-lactamase superfamily II)